jgi:hypothetical protein
MGESSGPFRILTAKPTAKILLRRPREDGSALLELSVNMRNWTGSAWVRNN